MGFLILKFDEIFRELKGQTPRIRGVCGELYNPDFNVTEFRNIKNEAGSSGFVLSNKHWRNSSKGGG